MTRTQHASAAVARRAPEPAFVDPTADYPELYASGCKGDCMAPEIPDGSSVLCSKTEAYQRGDLIVVYLRPEFVKPGEHKAVVKRLALAVPPWVKFPYRESPTSELRAILALSMNSMPGQMMMLPCTHVAAIHKVVGILKPQDMAQKYGDCERPARLRVADFEATRKAGRRLTAAVTKRRQRSKQIPDHSPAIHVNPDASTAIYEVSP